MIESIPFKYTKTSNAKFCQFPHRFRTFTAFSNTLKIVTWLSFKFNRTIKNYKKKNKIYENAMKKMNAF